MSPQTENDLPEIHRAAWHKATGAMEMKNYGYVIQLLQVALKECPGYLPVRKLIRMAAVHIAPKKSALRDSASAFSVLRFPGLIRKDPFAAMMEIEKHLERDPYSIAFNQLLKDAALEAKLPEVAIFALETIVEGHPKDTRTMHALAELYLAHDQPSKAVGIYDRLLQIAPNDLAAVKGSKNAAAAKSMKESGWSDPGSDYRNLLANPDEATVIEESNRTHHDEDEIAKLLVGLYEEYRKDSQNVNTARKIAELLEQKGDIPEALKWYLGAAGLAGNTDAALVRKASDLQLKLYDAEIAELESRIDENPDSEESRQFRPALEEARTNRAGFLLEEAKGRVDRNPSDLRLRYELGEIFMNLGQYRDAIAELQKARTGPHVRLRAMNLLGRCYTLRGMYDFAVKTLSEAVSELSQMDETKKEIVYNLGLAHEKMGQKEKCLDCMKLIYEVDCRYLDVADRVEGVYDGVS